MNISWMSRKRATRPLMRYSLWPLRYSLRLTTTSPGRVTSAGFSAFFLRLPLKPASPASCDGSACRVVSWLNSPEKGTSSPDCTSFSVIAELSVPSVARSSLSASSSASNTNRAASASSGSSIVMVTSAMPRGGRLVVPLKMQSAMRSARRDLWLCSPSTQLMASTTFDFPQPFGPTMQVVPVPLKVTTVRSQNDLKPTISTLRSLSKLSPLVVAYCFAAPGPMELGRELMRGLQVKGLLLPGPGDRNPNPTNTPPTQTDSTRVFGAKRDDFPFLGRRSLHATLLPVRGRKHKRLAGSRSEAQPPGAKMAVREKSVSRVWGRVKPYSTCCGCFLGTTRNRPLWTRGGRAPVADGGPPSLECGSSASAFGGQRPLQKFNLGRSASSRKSGSWAPTLQMRRRPINQRAWRPRGGGGSPSPSGRSGTDSGAVRARLLLSDVHTLSRGDPLQKRRRTFPTSCAGRARHRRAALDGRIGRRE